MRSDYEERKARRIERLKERAEQSRADSASLRTEASKLASVIPFGQPIHVGHHSERRDRNFRGRIHNKFSKSHDLAQKATALEERAHSAETNTAISSDDPNAIEKLQKKLEALQKHQEFMKAVNKLVRKDDRDGLRAMGLSEERIKQLFEKDFGGRIGFPGYEITNNGANIRTVKKRIEKLRKEASDVTEDLRIGDVEIVDSVEDNRVQITFPGKPSEEIRDSLKAYGFRWAPSLGCWQRFRGRWAWDAAKEIANNFAS